MPYIELHTNVALDADAEKAVAAGLSALASEQLGKAENWVMAEAEGGRALVYGGSSDPAAYVRLKSIGLLQGKCGALSAAICAYLERELSIAPARVYIEFVDLNAALFGWQGSTFG